MRNYAIGVGKTAERVGEGRPLGQVADDEIGEALEALWGSTAVNTWNARRAAVLSRLAWCAERGLDGPEVRTVARTEEILPLNIEDLDFAGRRALMKAKGAQSKARRRGQAREDVVLEPVYWDAGTARLLPRRLKNRRPRPGVRHSPPPRAGKVVSSRDVCPDSRLARLSYGQARALLDEHTAPVDPDHPDRPETTEPWS
ncbi:hypothetical protein [Nonomuraea dietziae]|uniref:hypothetical protein n=1 Tax=Nonomuraea dietziae TaxID=65515 RepID=UPI0033F1C5A3